MLYRFSLAMEPSVGSQLFGEATLKDVLVESNDKKKAMLKKEEKTCIFRRPFHPLSLSSVLSFFQDFWQRQRFFRPPISPGLASAEEQGPSIN